MESTKPTQLLHSSDYLSELKEALPPIIARQEVPRLLGGSISLGHLQNLDCEGRGPKRFALGRRICYRRADLIEWLRKHLREIGTDE